MFSTSASRPAAARQHPRNKVFQPVTMTTGTTPRRVHLLDLSVGGALAHADLPPEPGTVIRLHAGVSLGCARVAWRRGKRFGVVFTFPLAPTLIERIVTGRVAAG